MTNKKKKYFLVIFIFLAIILACSVVFNIVFVNGENEKEEIILTDKLELTTFIYDKDGNVIDTLHGNENRILVEYEKIPNNVVNAVIAVEDERFFSHKGIDIKRTLGAVFTYITNKGNSNFGGSTITQQLIKNITDDKESSISRKIREWQRALALEKKYTKQEIFSSYVNTIYFGEGSYGIEVAARNYFNKELKDVSLAESAIIAAAIQSPESTNPYKSEESRSRLLERSKIVLTKMHELKLISDEDYVKATNEEIKFDKEKNGTEVQSYFIDAVIEQVISDIMSKENVKYDVAKKMVYLNGYHIYTTFDPKVQNSIDSSYANSKLFGTDPDGSIMQSAMVVIDHTNGNVLGIKGGIEEKTGDLSLNRATQSYRQPGSCMKPLGAYGPAFEKGLLTPYSYIDDAPIKIGKWSPNNYYGYFYGKVTVKDAIAKSMNTPAVRANQMVDIEFAFEFAKSTGLKSLKNTDKVAAAMSLGGLTYGVTPLEMASSYATIANGGVYNEPKFYTKIMDNSTNEYIVKTQDPKRVMRESTAYMLTSGLEEVVTKGTAFGYVKSNNGTPFAGKTGNTDNDYDQWFCGFTPYYTISCWNGYDSNKPINRPYPYYSIRMFNTVANDLSKGQEYKAFNKPTTLIKTDICKLSNLIATDACKKDPSGYQITNDYIDTSAINNKGCDIHEMVKICALTSKKAIASCKYTYEKSYINKSLDIKKDSWKMVPTAECLGHTDYFKKY